MGGGQGSFSAPFSILRGANMALTIQEIINEADEKLPNSLTTASKIRKIYLQELHLLRTLFRRKTAMTFDLTADQFLYPLDFSKDKIIYVIVDGAKFDYEEIDDGSTSSPFIYTYENSIGINPTPETTVEDGILVYYYAEPIKYTESNLSNYPTLEADFHVLLVYSLLIDIAETSLNQEMVNNYTTKYNGLIQEYKKSNMEPELTPIRVG